MKTPITYYGGKQMMTKYLLELIPPHTIYCEPFFGGGALFFAKPKSEVEVINDINGEVVNFFKVIKNKFPELQKEIQATLHSRELYKNAMVVYEHPVLFSDVKRAWALWTLTNQGFAGLIGSWGFGKTNSKEKSLANKRSDFTKAYEARLKTAQIESNDALKVIDRCDSKDTFIYADPPYIGSDMGHYKGYSEGDYKALLDKLAKIKGKFLLSSYPSPILNQYIRKYKWKTKRIQKPVSVTKHTDKMKTEVLIFNYDPTKIKSDSPSVKKTISELSGIKESPEVKRAKEDAKVYPNLTADQLKMIYRLEKDAELEDGEQEWINIRKRAIEKEMKKRNETLEGKGKKKNPYSAIVKEVQFIDRFLSFHDKILYKNTFGIFIDDLQKAIEEKKITKKSPVAKEIMEIQNAVLKVFNTMRNAKHFVLKPVTIKHLKGIIEKYDNSHDDIDESYVKVKKKKVNLNGIDTNPSPQVNIMPSKDFTNLQFNTIGFKEKWLDFIGDPAPGFTAMVFGMPKMGKSYLCIDFAGYLAQNHGKVLYVAKEEKLDKTLQDKLKDKDVANENLFVADALPTDLSRYNFIFLDSVNKLGLTPKDLEKLKAENKGKSFIYVFQATKGGKFKGNNEFQHDVDVVIEVPEIGQAVQYGRFNQGGEMEIFPTKG